MPEPSANAGEGRTPLFTLDDVTMRVRDRKLLAHTNWTVRLGEQWAVLGPNGSGKSTLARTIAGELPCAAGHVHVQPGQRLALVSFERQQELYARELELDNARHFTGKVDDVLTARGLIESRSGAGTAAHHAATGGFDILHLLDRPFRHLSAGEMRKALIVRALADDPTLLILDEPFDGLDSHSRRSLSHYLDRIIEQGRHVVLVTHHAEEILASVTHVLALRDGEVVGIGTRSEMLDPAKLESLYGAPLERRIARRSGRPTSEPAVEAGEPLIELKKVTVSYNGHTVLRDLDWRLRRGERWGIFGPNGSGKTTILSLITGESMQSYSNDVRLFGRRRGSGESIWDLKRRIGIVTPHLQLGYTRAVTGLEAVLSGYFDSIGLYRRPTDDEIAGARRWLEILGIGTLGERHFTRLSYGQRRLILIARAMVKGPELLVLDEPCQGLDPHNRHRVLDAVDTACAGTNTSLLYVTHHDEEHPRILTHALRLSGPGEPAEIERFD